MFNLYKFEQKLKLQKDLEVQASAEAQAKFEKKLCKSDIIIFLTLKELREDMSKKYRDRVTKFVREVNFCCLFKLLFLW